MKLETLLKDVKFIENVRLDYRKFLKGQYKNEKNFPLSKYGVAYIASPKDIFIDQDDDFIVDRISNTVECRTRLSPAMEEEFRIEKKIQAAIALNLSSDIKPYFNDFLEEKDYRSPKFLLSILSQHLESESQYCKKANKAVAYLNSTYRDVYSYRGGDTIADVIMSVELENYRKQAVRVENKRRREENVILDQTTLLTQVMDHSNVLRHHDIHNHPYILDLIAPEISLWTWGTFFDNRNHIDQSMIDMVENLHNKHKRFDGFVFNFADFINKKTIKVLDEEITKKHLDSDNWRRIGIKDIKCLSKELQMEIQLKGIVK